MIHENNLEAKLYELERELRVAELNNWEFDISILKDEIKEVEHELYCEVCFWERKMNYGATDEEVEEAWEKIQELNDKIRYIRSQY